MTHTTRRLAWLTDIHLEMLTDAEFDASWVIFVSLTPPM
jgi:hypothetical protein